ncbi:UNVERIFIED_CONTAM: hypothetical protein HDU68_000743 [Siphonaria sp. JEL0065]|nr:hypothetical protein HDU68_000743 [Siphonaria sp. JEL0065]
MAFNGIPETEEPASSNPRESVLTSASSISTIESDDMEMETKYEVVEHWMPQRFDELELIPGDTVIVYKVFEDGWCDGKIEGTEDTGAFPFACLKADSWSLGNLHVTAEPLEEEQEEASNQQQQGETTSAEDLNVQDLSMLDTMENNEYGNKRPSEVSDHSSFASGTTGTSTTSRRSSEYNKSNATTNSSGNSQNGGSQNSSSFSLPQQKHDKAKSRFSGILKNIDQYVVEFDQTK